MEIEEVNKENCENFHEKSENSPKNNSVRVGIRNILLKEMKVILVLLVEKVLQIYFLIILYKLKNLIMEKIKNLKLII